MSATGDKPKFSYQEGETVLCFHGPLLYEAKCLKAEDKDNIPQYLIHYSGWNKSWDEWVPSPRVLKYSDENLKKQKELLATHGGKIANRLAKNPRRSILPVDKANDGDKSICGDGDKSLLNESIRSKLDESRDTRRKKAKAEDYKETDENYSVKVDVSIIIPDELKQQLAEDWNIITAQHKLAVLPATKTVDAILNEYYKYKVEKKCDKSITNELIWAIKDYFESCLQSKLLYKFERLQFNEITKQHANKKLIEIYGSIHLLRLFVKIGECLSYTIWDELSVKQLQFNIEDLISYLQENRSKLFNNSKDYYTASSTYVQKYTSV